MEKNFPYSGSDWPHEWADKFKAACRIEIVLLNMESFVPTSATAIQYYYFLRELCIVNNYTIQKGLKRGPKIWNRLTGHQRNIYAKLVHLVDEFDILQIVGEGWFGKILLVEHRGSQTEMVLKAVPKPYVSLRDFYREFHYGLHLGIHRNIVTTYDVAFETAGFYVFTQEYAPLGDLTSNVTETGIGETYSKRLAKQVGAAIDYMHTKDIIHRDIKLDNVLIYRSDFSRVKLCDFGESYQTGSIVERRNEWLPYSPPEVLDVKPEATYKADPSHDVWQFGIVVFVCLTGCLPWQKAATDDPRYARYFTWQNTMVLPLRRTPKLFKLLSSRAQRMFKRFLEPRSERRPKGLADLTKFLDDRWLAKTAEKEMAEYETDELCPSMYSFHSSPDEKNRLLYTLADCGIETNVDRQQKKNRIKDWIESSIIVEEDEEENEETNSASPSSSVSREPVAGHISSIRKPQPADKPKDIKTTLKDAAQKHFDPRTGALQQGPSEMGVTSMQHAKSASPSNYSSTASTLNNADSLLTLGSRQDLLASNLQMYNSLELDLNRLGEQPQHNLADVRQMLNQSLSSVHPQLTVSNNLMPTHAMHLAAPSTTAKNSIGVGTHSGGAKSILQRSKSDSLHRAMYASTPAIVSNEFSGGYAGSNLLQQQSSGYAPNGSAFFTTTTAAAATGAMPGNGYGNLLFKPTNTSSNKSVTFTGLANAFTSLAQISLPANATLIEQQAHSQQLPAQQDVYYFNRQQNDSQVKDSAYGSTEVNSNSPGRSTGGSSGTEFAQQPPQQRVYNGMKDTAYDRMVVNKSNNTVSQTRRRR